MGQPAKNLAFDEQSGKFDNEGLQKLLIDLGLNGGSA